jgi:hypothetical protein
MDDFFAPIGSTSFAVNQGYDTVSGLQYNFTGGSPIGGEHSADAMRLDFGTMAGAATYGGLAVGSVLLGSPALAGVAVGLGAATASAFTTGPGETYSPAGQAVIDGFNGASLGPQAPMGEPIYPVQTDWFFGGN